MAKIVVKIDVPDVTKEEYEKAIKENYSDYFPNKNEPNKISLDVALLNIDPNDGDFYLFEFVGVEE